MNEGWGGNWSFYKGPQGDRARANKYSPRKSLAPTQSEKLHPIAAGVRAEIRCVGCHAEHVAYWARIQGRPFDIRIWTA